MRNGFGALLSVVAGGMFLWCPVDAQTASVPFAEGISIEAAVGSNITLLARRANGAYVNLQFSSAAPYSLGPAATLLQLISDGPKSLLAAPGGPAGVGRQSQAFALTDLDNRGTLGIAAAFSTFVYVFKATFTGNNGPSISTLIYPVGPDVNSVFFADFNGDGYPDLAVAFDETPGGIAILLNKGDGTFGSAITYASGTPAARFAVLDLNHDGVLDIATVTFGGTVTVLLGKGDGTFRSLTPFAAGGSGPAIAIADFDHDGIPDIAVGTSVMPGNGDGTFRAALPLPVGAANIWAFAAGDLDGDGKMDLVYADISGQVVAPLFGNSDGTFRVGQAYVVSQMPDSLVLADYNNDGRLDIINGNGDERGFGPSDQSGNLDILLNNGDGTFQGAPAFLEAPYGFLQASGAGAAVANFGGTFPGILVSSYNGTLTLFKGDGKGGFQTPQNFTIPPALAGSTGYAGTIVAADFNGDGLPDAAVITSNGIAILLGNASVLGTPATISTGGVTPRAIVAADFDGDGNVDLVFLSSGDPNSGSPGTLAFLKGNGNGAFGAPVAIPAGVSPVFASEADVNGDGMPDIIFADNGVFSGAGAGIFVALSKGGGTFQAPVSVFSGLYPAFAVADLNGDSKLDLIAATQVGGGNSEAYWLPGNGTGTFQSPIAIVMSGANDNFLLVQDFNGDGILDMIIAHQDGGTGFVAGSGNGKFSEETPFNSAAEPTLLLSTDLNGDKKADLIVVGVSMAVLLNDSAPPTTIQTSPAGLQFSVDGNAAQTAPQTLNLSQGPHTIAVTTPQAGSTGTQYVFTGWSDSGALSHSITVGTSAATYTATFKTQYQLTTSASPSVGGTVTPATGTFYDAGAVVPVNAAANSGYTFTNWTGAVANPSSSATTVTMTAPESVTANFSGGSGHPAFFNGEASLGSGVYYLQFPDTNVFGYYNYPSGSILYHYNLGFEAFVPAAAGQIYFYDFATGHWWYTSSTLFPYLYDFTLNTFIYYFVNTTNPRYFSNLTTGKIFTM